MVEYRDRSAKCLSLIKYETEFVLSILNYFPIHLPFCKNYGSSHQYYILQIFFAVLTAAATCSTPPAPSNGRIVSLVTGPYQVGTTFTLECNSGYTLTGSNTITCLTGGTWSTNTATCTANGNFRH